MFITPGSRYQGRRWFSNAGGVRAPASVAQAVAGTDNAAALTAAAAINLPGAFGHQLLHVREEQASGVNGTSTLTSGAWRTRVLNTTKTNEISGASLASNQVSLPAGTYYGIGRGCGYSSGFTQIKLRNITDSSDILIGEIGFNSTIGGGTNDSQTWVDVAGRFTLAAAKTIELQMQFQVTSANLGATFGVVNVFSGLKIWKVA